MLTNQRWCSLWQSTIRHFGRANRQCYRSKPTSTRHESTRSFELNMDVTLFDVIKPVITSAVIIMNMSLNVLVIAVIFKHPQLREDRTTLFMLSLTLSDLANACTAMPIIATICSNATPQARAMRDLLPKFHLMCTVWFAFNSLHSLCWMTVYKMIAITKPLRYEQILSRNRCRAIVCFTWLSGVVVATMFLHGKTTWDMKTCVVRKDGHSIAIRAIFLIGFTLGQVTTTVVIVYSTARIFCVIVRTHLRITTQVNSVVVELASVRDVPWLTLKSIRSGRNALLMCLAYRLLTSPIAVDVVAVVMRKEMHLPDSYRFAAVWIMMQTVK